MSFSLNTTSGVITQSGTDNNLSGLSSITGVTVYDDDPTKGKITYDMGDLRLQINGTLSHDPDRELMIFHHEKSSSSDSVIEPVLKISAGATYNYGIKTTTSDGKVGYSSGCGLMFTGRGYSNWHPSDNAINFDSQTANFVCRGGVIEASRGLSFAGNADIEETVFINASDRYSMEIRTFGSSNISTDRAQNMVLAGGISVMDAYRMTEQKIVFREGAISRVFGDYFEAELFDFDVSKNIFQYDVGNCASTDHSIQDHHIVNSATGSDVRTMWRNTTGNTNQMGNTFIHKEVSFNIKDTSASGIEGVKLYLQDNPSSFAKSISITSISNRVYTQPTLANAVLSNSNKTISYDYTSQIEYEKTTDVNGDIAKFRVLTATQFLEKKANDSSATQYFNTFSGGKWRESDGQEPKYSDWDTSRFGNFYKVDRRSDSNSNADDFTFKFCSYGHMLSSTTQPLKGLGELAVNWVLFDDLTITEPDKSKVDLYEEIDTPERFYDRAKSYLADNYAGESATIVTRDGNSIDAGSYDVVVDATASSVFAISGNTLTIKATRFVGNIATTGTTTLSNGAEVIGTFGSTTVLPWEVKNVEGTSRIQLVNVTQSNTEVVNTKLTSSDPFIDASGTYTASQIAVGDVIRLRVTCVVGATALLPVLQTGVATTTGITFQVDQEADTVYNSNGINGSTISTLTADYTNPMGVDVSDADGTASVKEIYAFFVYSTTTEDGVDLWFGGMRAIDNANYEVITANSDIRIQNIGSNAVIVTDGRMYRDDQASILYAEDGDKPIVMDSGALVTSIQPQVEAGLNANAKIASMDKNSKLIPALL